MGPPEVAERRPLQETAPQIATEPGCRHGTPTGDRRAS
jgi:hypothetical protein